MMMIGYRWMRFEQRYLYLIQNQIWSSYSDLYLTDENGIVSSKCFEHKPRPLPSGDLYPILVERNFIPVHSLLWKRQVLEEVGGFRIVLVLKIGSAWSAQQNSVRSRP